MSTFTIDTNNNITAHTSSQEATLVEGEAVIQFNSEAGLAQASGDWPMSRLVDIWNSIPGNTEVKKFQDRNKAVARIWKAIQQLSTDGRTPAPKASKPKAGRKLAKAVKKTGRAKKLGKASERANKKAEVIAMMQRAKGATLADIMKATDWQAHTVRGFVSILGSKGGQKIESSRSDSGERTYRIVK